MKKKLIIGLFCIIFTALIISIALIIPIKDSGVITSHIVQAPKGSFNVEDFPPVIEAVSEYIGYAGDLITIEVNATDPNGKNITINFTSPLNSSGQWQSTVNDDGIYYVNITASDGIQQTIHNLTIKLGSYCGDDNCSSGETCSTCPEDCGICLPILPVIVPVPARRVGCFHKWECSSDWSNCTDSKQTRICKDIGTCLPYDEKLEEKGCEMPPVPEEVPEEEIIPVEEIPIKPPLLIELWIIVIAIIINI